MIIRATQDLAADTEITFWYKSPLNEGYTKRQNGLQHWGFICDCTICRDLQNTKKTLLIERNKLRADCLKYYSPQRGITNIAKFAAILEKMWATYGRPASDVPRLSLWDPLLALAMKYAENGRHVEAINSALRVLESLGYIIDGGRIPQEAGKKMVVKKWGLMADSLVDCWILLSKSYERVAPKLKHTADVYAKISYKICVGEDETFDETCVLTTFGKVSSRLSAQRN